MIRKPGEDAQRGQRVVFVSVGYWIALLTVNLPGILLNAILRNFSDAVEKGSKLKFIMYSAVSLLFWYLHCLFCKLVFYIFRKTVMLLFSLFFLNSSMILHSSPSRQLWTYTTAFFLPTLPVSSLSSTRSMMGNVFFPFFFYLMDFSPCILKYAI